MIKQKVLKKALSLHKSGCSAEVAIRVILQLTNDARDREQESTVDTLVAFMHEEHQRIIHRFEMLEAEYCEHLEVCRIYHKKEIQND